MMTNTYEVGRFYLQETVSVGDIKGSVVGVRIIPGTKEPIRIYELNWFQAGELKTASFYEWQIDKTE